MILWYRFIILIRFYFLFVDVVLQNNFAHLIGWWYLGIAMVLRCCVAELVKCYLFYFCCGSMTSPCGINSLWIYSGVALVLGHCLAKLIGCYFLFTVMIIRHHLVELIGWWYSIIAIYGSTTSPRGTDRMLILFLWLWFYDNVTHIWSDDDI